MNDCGHGRHCPFLNRTDARCARHFSLDQLQHTFDHCFGQYETCGVYLELLYERRVRRAAALLEKQTLCTTPAQSGMDSPDANTDPDLIETPTRRPAAAPIVQLTVSGRAALRRRDQGSADPALVPHASGV